ncbi:hypothetical protein AVEN_60010-1 [Araneus ventricosus]|uniref:Uncharacterized protein n=1 Tax=Araneus ventricosus TaxID=182803 RepID=A0A4Y2CBE1_ARAVE|nr:hypothetical protein AVEN_60010-1 [Araneus ventricosus]
MKTFIYIILVFVLALGITSGKTDSDRASATGESSKRRARQYDFFSPENFPINPVQTEEAVDPVYTDDGSDVATPPRADGQYPDFNVYKGYDKPPSYDYYPFFQNYKGLPYYPKGGSGSLEDNGIAFPNEEQMMEMMNKMNQLQINSKKDQQGFLSKLITDPKTYMLAAIIPLAVMIASFVPFLANYFTSGPSMPAVMTTIANSKMARAVQDIDVAQKVLENLIEFGSKVLEDDECIQKAICELALSKSGPDNARYAAFVINRISKEHWLENWGAKELVSALEESSCKNVCRSIGKKMSFKKH